MAKKKIKSFQTISKKIIKRIRLRTWIALLVILVVGVVGLIAYFTKPETKAATMTLTTNDSTTFQVDVSNRYRAVLRKDQTTDYILIYDRAQSDGSPNNTYEFMGPFIREGSANYTLRRDSGRVTTLLEATPTRIRVRVSGLFMNEASAATLTDGSNNILVTEEYTFTPDGFYVNNSTNFRTSGVALDSATAEDGYNWMMVDADITADAFTGSFVYGSGTAETTTAADTDATFEETSYFYGVFPATDDTGYQSAMIGIPNDGWFNFISTTTTTDNWNLDQSNSGSIDRLHTRERATTPTGVRNAQWFFLLLDENSLDSEAERASRFNDQRITDLLDWNTGYGWDQEAPYRSNLYYQDGFEVGDHYLCDGDGVTWSGGCSGEAATAIRSEAPAAYNGSYGARMTVAADNGQAYAFSDAWTATRVASVRTMFRATQLGLGDTSDYAQVLSVGDADYTERCRFWVDNNASAADYRFTTESLNNSGSTITASSVDVVEGRWYNLEIYAVAESATGANNASCTYYVDGVQIRSDTSQNWGASANQLLVETIAVGSTYMFNPDSGETSIFDYDNVVLIPEYVGVNNWDIGEGAYTGTANNSQITVDIDGATYNRYNPLFRFKNYRLNSIPSSITVEGTTMTSGNQFNASLKPFSDADFYTNTGATYTQLSSGGDTSLAAEYLNDTTNDATLTFDEATDYLYLGLDSRFSGVYSDLETVGVGSPTMTWEYCSANSDTTTACDTWTTLAVTDSDTATGASTFTRSGHFSFPEPTVWIQATVNSGPTLYYIRASRSAGSFSTYPVENTIRPDILTLQYLGTVTADATTLTLVTTTNTQTAYWKFDEGVDNTCAGGSNDACDSTVFGNDIARSGALWQKEDVCISGKCVWFDDSNDYFTRADDNDFDFTASDSFTVTGWFRMPTKSAADVLIGKQNSTAGWKVQVESDGDLTFGIDDDSTSFPEDSATSTAATYDDDTWHHFAAVKNATTSITLYIDGVQVAQDATISSTGSLANSNALYIGVDGNGSSSPFGGFLDEIRVYPAVRTNEQIRAELIEAAANKGSSAVLGLNIHDYLSDGLAGYWKLDETSGNAADSSGKNATLTNLNTTTYVGSIFGNGADIERDSSQCLYVDDTVPLSFTSSFTLAAWIRPESTTAATSFDIITKYEGSVNRAFLFGQVADELRIMVGSAVDYADTTDVNLVTGTWYHVAVTYNAPSQTVKIYVNGVERSITVTGTIPASITDSTERFHIGCRNSATTPQSFYDGRIDEARAYNRTLDGSEIKLLYAWAAPPSALWKMDENTGTTTNDSSANGINSSAFTGNTAFVPGKYGAGLSFDGTDDNARFVEATAIDVGSTTDSYTVSAWVKTSANYSGNAMIIAKDDGSGAYPFRLYFNSSEQACFAISDGTNAPEACGSTALNDGAWHHIAGVRSVSADTIYVYVDGTLINSTTDTTTATAANNDDVSVGNSGTSYTGADWNGAIDTAMIYTYARSAGQITEDLNGGHPTAGSPIGSQVGYWKLDEGYGQAVNNAISSSYAGTLGSSSSVAADDPSWSTSCKVQKCLTFASGDEVQIPDNAALRPSNFTISAWINVSSVATSLQFIVNKGWGYTNGAFLLTTSTNDVRLYMSETGGGGPWYAEATDVLTTDTWYHVVGTYDGTTMKVYVNGTQGATTAVPSGTGLASSTSALRIGDAATSLTGAIDEVKIYNSALTRDQILVDMNTGATLAVSTTVSDTANFTDGAGTAPTAQLLFDENTGTSAFDTTGGTNTGTLSGPTWAPGKAGPGLLFDGVNDSVSLANESNFDYAAGDFTASLWVKPSATQAANANIIRKEDGGGGGFGIEMDGSANSNTYYAGWKSVSGNECWASNSFTLTPNVWQHLTYRKNGTTREIFVNNILVSSCTGTTAAIINNTSLLYFGMLGSGTRYWAGTIDQFVIYGYVRTNAQIAYDYNRGASLVKYNFDECSGTTLNNTNQSTTFTSNGSITIGGTGTNTSTGNCTSGGSAHAWYNGATGKYGSSLSFDGTDDYSDTTDVATLRFDTATLDFSLSAWIKRDTTGAMTIVSKEDADNDGWRLILTSGNVVTCSVDAIDISSTSTITDTNWHHVACTVDRDGNGQVYIDGKANGSATAISSEAMANTAAMRIGARSYTITNYFDGQIDQFEVFNYALSAAQVRNLFNEGSAIRFGANN